MHELTLCKNLIDIILQQAANNHCLRVKAVYLEIGQLVAVEKTAMQFSFEVLSRDTIAEGAALKFVDVAARALCQSCTKTVIIDKRYQFCQFCGNFSLSIISGEELRVKSMEVE